MPRETRQCQNCKNQFTIEPDDLAFYEKFDVPPPEQCPYCRWKHLLGFWIFGRFRIAKSALSGKNIITVFPETVQFPLYEHKEWVSDAWDPLKYGQEYNPSRSFFEQFAELQAKVPHPHTSGVNNYNCEWSDDLWDSKNCYLSRAAANCEDLSYCYRTLRCKGSIDLTFCFDLDNSYDCFYCFKSYNLKYSFNSRDCVDSMFLADCRNCMSCFMCWNLHHKQHHIFNKPHTKEEYAKKMKEFDVHSYSSVQSLKKEFERVIREETIHRADFNIRTVNSSGNFLDRTKNCRNSYFVQESENAHHSFRGWNYKDVIDCAGSIAEKAVLSVMDGYTYDVVSTSHCGSCRFAAYSEYCEECENCFGCVALRKKRHCILNKQYAEGEYAALVAKIKADMKSRGEWGRFFPLSLAYSGYNLTLGQMFFPETKERIAKLGGKWDELPTPDYKDAISADSLPEKIDGVGDDMTRQRIICLETKLSYNIAAHELAFCRLHGIPPPRRHFDLRTLDRFRPMTLMVYPQRGICCLCKKETEHYYAPELGYKNIACVDCYQREMA